MKINKKRIILIISLLTLVLVTGCSNKDNISTSEDKENIENIVSIDHELGSIEVIKNPKNIIVFDYGTLDTLNTLGVDITGLPKQSLPEYLNKYSSDKYEDVGTLFEPNFDKIFDLEPDLIIISGRQADLYEEFQKIAPTLYLNIDGSDYINSFKSNINIIKEIFSIDEKLDEELDNIDKKLEILYSKTENNEKKGLFLMTNDGNMSVYGKDSRFGIIYNEFNIKPADENIEVSNHGQKINYEYLKQIDPDYLFVMDRAVIAGGETYAKDMLENEIVKGTKAYKNNNIIYLNSESWYVAAGGIESLNVMIDDISNALE